MDKSDMYAIAWNAIDNVHDMDVRLTDYAKAAVDALDDNGALLDTARLQARLMEIEATGERIAPRAPLVSAWLMLRRNGWTATIWLRGPDQLEATGPTPDAAIDALAAQLAERDPVLQLATLGIDAEGRPIADNHGDVGAFGRTVTP